MKKVLIVAVALCTALASCQNSSRNIKSFSLEDSLAYSIGIIEGVTIKRADSTLNTAVIAVGIADLFKNTTKMTVDEAYAFINEYFSVRLPAKNKAEGTAWLEDVKAKNPNIKVTASGLMYEIINEGDMAVKATDDADQVMVNYRGTFKEGNEFDKSDSISLALNRVIPAWTEGMKLIGKGGEIVLWVPAELGYGERPSGPIPANSPLKFEIKLLDVIPAAPVAE